MILIVTALVLNVGRPLVGLLTGNEYFYYYCPGDPQGASLHLLRALLRILLKRSNAIIQEFDEVIHVQVISLGLVEQFTLVVKQHIIGL